MDFKEYVKGVLPAEWGNNWNQESLKAGAIAVKMYGWSMYETYGYVWDCNWDQVYRPEWRTESTDKAVDDTWDWVLLHDKKIVRTYYDDRYATCLGREQEENCMGQWDSYDDAKEGMNWKDIITKYYDGILVRETEEKPIRLYYLYWLY